MVIFLYIYQNTIKNFLYTFFLYSFCLKKRKKLYLKMSKKVFEFNNNRFIIKTIYKKKQKNLCI